MLVISQLKFVIDVFGLLTNFNSLIQFKCDTKTKFAQSVQANSERNELRPVTKQNLVS